MASLRETFITFSLVGLLVLSMLSFVSIGQSENRLNQSILDNSIINRTLSNLDANLSSFSGEAQTQKDAFDADEPKEGFGTLLIFGIVSAGRKFISLITLVYNTIIVLPAQILGIPEVVTSVMSGILLFTLISLGFKLYRSGD